MIMAKILVVATNVEKYETTDRATGVWLGEMTHFVEEMAAAGHEIDYVSPKGGYVPIDPASLKAANDTDWKWYGNDIFKQRALAATMKPSAVNPLEYAAIYYAGGHGAMWDFKDNTELQEIAETIYANGGFVTGVCHGVVGLVNVVDRQTGVPVLHGKKVTGFSTMEERLNGTKKQMPYLTQDAMTAAGGKYKAKRPLKSYVRIDGRVITGQNPPSAQKVGKKLAAALEAK
ncbi:type 1 glutamine amidotransferase domain-containing protein [Macrococcus equipercicus]|uniref:Type 1 glutamine amidotransferase domain-containing protein n=1 Tax=Macrococcus equipercicus TaxID=69967 RepID=A0A9Q9F2C0_9STAP|nr:type 1 glutamine amidotransferase domain-containing protein [Macrococcus equipercicus]UTH14231.1 type 1 glutamine amidotransferase domain-containing protein [Macrococcus equipercicus]